MANPGAATEQLLELLLTLKKTTPVAAKSILNSQPAIAYALISLMVQMNAINVEVFQKTLEASGGASASAAPPSVAATSSINNITTPQNLPPPAAPAPISAIPPHLQSQYRTSTPPSIPAHTPTPPYGYNAPTPSSNGPHHAPTPPGGYGQYNQTQQGYPPQAGYSGYQQQYQQQHQYQQPPYQQQQSQQGGYPGYQSYGGQHQQPPPAPSNPTPAPPLPDALANIPDEQKALIMRVLSMTPEQINMLPAQERATYIQIRHTLGVPIG